jgi:hypothetical protein
MRAADVDNPAGFAYLAAITGPQRPVFHLTCPVGFSAKRAWETLSGLENGGQRRARFLHPEHEVPGVSF